MVYHQFPILSVFAASVPSLLLGQFFLFVPEDSFFFFGHRIIDLGIIFSRTTSCPTRIHVCVFVCRFGLTARIHIDTLNFSFFLVCHDRGEYLPDFSVLAQGWFRQDSAQTFSPARCQTCLEEWQN